MRLNKFEVEHIQNLGDQYARDFGVEKYTVREVREWAVSAGLLSATSDDIDQMLDLKIARSWRRDKRKDAQGRLLRTRWCLRADQRNPETDRVEQRDLWFCIDEASVETLTEAYDQYYRAEAKNVRVLKAKEDYLNQRRDAVGLRKIQNSFDFRGDDDRNQKPE